MFTARAATSGARVNENSDSPIIISMDQPWAADTPVGPQAVAGREPRPGRRAQLREKGGYRSVTRRIA